MAGTVNGVQSQLHVHADHRRWIHHRLPGLRRMSSSQGLVTSCFVIYGLVFIVFYLETSRQLIPRNFLSKRDLHSLTAGFTKDLPARVKAQHVPSRLDPRPRRPGAFLVGFSHCGNHVVTTALSTHPDIVVNRKEIKYFSNTKNRSTDWYVAHMPPSLEHHVTIDISDSYINDKTALMRIKSFNQTARIILVVCDPVSRLLAMHADTLLKHQPVQAANGSKPTRARDVGGKPVFNVSAFRVWLKPSPDAKSHQMDVNLLTEVGDYLSPVFELYNIFPHHQIHIVEKSKLYQNPRDELTRLYRFLKVEERIEKRNSPKIYMKDVDFLCFNVSLSGRKCMQDSSLYTINILKENDKILGNKLAEFFHPFNKHLFLFLQNYFNWMTQSNSTL